MRSQKRRRAQAAGAGLVVPAPLITNGYTDWGRTEEGWADVIIEFTFDDPGFAALGL